MLETARFAVVAGLCLVVGALVLHGREAWTASRRVVEPHPVGVGARDETPAARSAPDRRPPSDGASATLGVLAAVALTVGLLARAVAVGHGPFSNQYEFAVAFAWGVVVASVVARRRVAMPAVSWAALPVAVAMLLYAMTLDSGDRGLVPALQSRWLLTAHVLAAVLAYGAAAISCGAAVLELVQLRRGADAPQVDRLDEVAYRAVVIAYPLLTAMLVLGAVWADRAWGTYWSWDPKETSALMTWLIYGGYLHARVVKGWRGRRAAWLLVLGFAAVLFTYFGNLFFGGLHSYA
jgi:cytochrome c-type biogenesis protein CcsB